jgi:DNA-binding NarL/FixJ family response regulator
MQQKRYAGQGDELSIFYLDDDQDDLDVFRDIVDDIDASLMLSVHNTTDNLMHALDNPPPVPGVLFLDLNMPGKNGMDVLKELRGSARFSELPIVILSTSTSAQTIDRCRELGANLYIPKGNDYNAFRSSIEHVLKIDWNDYKPQSGEFFYSN